MARIIATGQNTGIEADEMILLSSEGGGGITPAGNVNITSMNSVDVTNYATAKVVDADLVAGNIKKDVNILGVTGTYEGGGGSGKNIQYSDGVSKVTNKTAYTATSATITVTKTGTYKCTWFHYSYASSSSYYLTRLYKGTTAIGSTHASPVYSSGPQAVTESNISLNAGDVLTVYARTRSGSSYYTCVAGLMIEEV